MTKSLYFLSFMVVTLSACGQKKNEFPKQELKEEITKQKESKYITMSTNPESIVKSLITAMSSNDAEKIRSLFDENASQAYGNSPAKSGKAFFSWLESDIIDRKGHVDNAQYEVNDNEVIVTGQYSSIGYTNKANFLFKVKDGKIVSWQMRY